MYAHLNNLSLKWVAKKKVKGLILSGSYVALIPHLASYRLVVLFISLFIYNYI